MDLKEKHLQLCVKLKCPKTRYNKFGDFYSRNIDDIFSGLKPLLEEFRCTIKFDNELFILNDMVWRKSIATLSDCESDKTLTTTAIARETLDHKKMSVEQMSGTCMSYVNKYALGEMLLIDDSLDPDEVPPVNGGNNPKPGNQGKNKGKNIPPKNEDPLIKIKKELNNLINSKKLKVTDFVKMKLSNMDHNDLTITYGKLSDVKKPITQDEFEKLI